MTSRVAELAREEAVRAEGESPDEGDTPEPVSEPEEPLTTEEPHEPPAEPQEPAQGPTPPQTEAELEARAKAWERERDRHMRELKKRDEYRYSLTALCPLCDGHGLYMPVLEEGDAVMRRSFILTQLGGEPERELKMADNEEECATCAGWGMVAHPTKAATQKETPCMSCSGKGWVLKVAAPPVYNQPAPVPLAVAPQPYAGQNGQGPDQWGRLPGQPRYGEHPSVGGW